MKLTAHLPPVIRLTEVIETLRGWGMDVRLKGGELIATPRNQNAQGNVVTLHQRPTPRREAE